MASAGSCGSVKWANRQLGIMSKADSDAKESGTPGTKYNFGCGSPIPGDPSQQQAFGVQSMGYDANFDLSPVFEFCDSEPYFINEGLPQVEITVNKILDGSCPIYSMATKEASQPTLFGRAACKCHIASAIFPCDEDSTGSSGTSTPRAVVVFPDAQINSISYSFGSDNSPFSEDITFVGNDIIWTNPTDDINDIADCTGTLGFSYTAQFLADVASISFNACCASGTPGPSMPSGQIRKPQYREDFIWDETNEDFAETLDVNGALCDPDTTVLPAIIPGVACNGTNLNNAVAVQSITISADLNREELNALGSRAPRTRTITPPITVSTSIEVVSEFDSALSATEAGAFTPSLPTGSFCETAGENLRQGTIRVAICGGLRIYTGTQNKIQSISMSGASTDGDNLTITYNFQTFNTLTVLHENGSEDNSAAWWAARDTWLCN